MKPAMPIAVAALSTLALAACGSDSKDGDEQENASPAVALKEVGETREALRAALTTYKMGRQSAAEDAVAEAYVQHFEEVEGSLGKRDAELNEHLEKAISTDLRSAMKAGKPASEIESQVDAILADLEKAQVALR
jgi:DNA repair exonuclease SbcCD ATPase subunit